VNDNTPDTLTPVLDKHFNQASSFIAEANKVVREAAHAIGIMQTRHEAMQRALSLARAALEDGNAKPETRIEIALRYIRVAEIA